MRRLRACIALAILAGCGACRPNVDPITVKQQPGAIIVGTINCTY